jgi:hypothetical protein
METRMQERKQNKKNTVQKTTTAVEERQAIEQIGADPGNVGEGSRHDNLRRVQGFLRFL